MKRRVCATINAIIIHCSDSKKGSAVEIDQWHRGRPKPFDMIGYHFVINNSKYNDGHIELGRDLKYVGAHAYKYNQRSIGICLIGKPINDKCTFTGEQIISLLRLCKELMADYCIPVKNVIGHCEVSNKVCPGIDVWQLRKALTL